MPCLHSPSPISILTLPKIMANRNESECIVVLLNREEYHRSTSRAAKFCKKSWNRTMRSKRLCASKDQTGSGEATLEAPFRRDPASMHLPDRRYLGLVGTVAAFGFASYVRECFSGGLTLLMLIVSSHGLFGHEILPGFTFRNFSCGYTEIRLGCMRVVSRWVEFRIYRDDTFCSRKRERQHLRLILGEVTANHRPKRATRLETGRDRNQAPAKPLSPE